MHNEQQKTALVTGAAGFIGYHISRRLLDEGWRVVGVDCMSDYYDVSLKEARENLLLNSSAYRSVHEKVETQNVLKNLFAEESPSVIIHLAAQAGVRYSMENPRAYLESNVNGTFELLEAARSYPPKHMLLASTSSVYGANEQMPYREADKADHQMSFYAATKKSTENMAHSYSHLFNIPITMFRFFTVYGPWGRPDMALFKFTKAILNEDQIDVYNNGNMLRDFTYIDDLIESIYKLIPNQAPVPKHDDLKKNNEYIGSPVAPYRVINIGNSRPVKLLDFIEEIEKKLNRSAKKNFMPIQAGDVPATWADVNMLHDLIEFLPQTSCADGVGKFIDWYLDFYNLHQ